MKKEIIIRSFKKTVISIKIGEENNQIYILSKFTDDLPIPKDINISDIIKIMNMSYLKTQNIMIPNNQK